MVKAGSFRRLEELPIYRAVEDWSTKTETGDRSEVPDMPDSVDFWREVSQMDTAFDLFSPWNQWIQAMKRLRF